MGLFKKFRYHVISDVGLLEGLIKQWVPSGCAREKDFELSLYDFLVPHLEGFSIIRQFGIGRTRADLVIERSLAIELKHDLDTKGQLQRLIGQLTEYEHWRGRLIILLTGRQDHDLLLELRTQIRAFNDRSRNLLPEPDKVVMLVKREDETR